MILLAQLIFVQTNEKYNNKKAMCDDFALKYFRGYQREIAIPKMIQLRVFLCPCAEISARFI